MRIESTRTRQKISFCHWLLSNTILLLRLAHPSFSTTLERRWLLRAILRHLTVSYAIPISWISLDHQTCLQLLLDSASPAVINIASKSSLGPMISLRSLCHTKYPSLAANESSSVESLEPKDFSTGADSANDNNLTESISSAQLGRSEFFASVDHRNRTAEAISLEELIQNTLRSSASASEALRQFTVHRLSSYLADLPPDWKAMGLYSAFLVNYSKTELALPEGKMSIEPKVFEAVNLLSP